jgi:hypothetical protein
MSTTVELRAELEDRRLEDHELEIVSGGGISVQQATTGGWYAPWASGGGAFHADAALYTGLAWDWYSANVLSGKHLSLPAGL